MIKVGQKVRILNNVWYSGKPFYPEDSEKNGIGKIGVVTEINCGCISAPDFIYTVTYGNKNVTSFREKDLQKVRQLLFNWK